MAGPARGRSVRSMAPACAPAVAAVPEVGFTEHYPTILRYVRSVVRDADEAQDLTQETFLRAHRRRDSLRDPEAALPWLYSIATHVCLDRLRQRSRQAPAESEADPEQVLVPDRGPTAERLVEQEDMRACVEAFVRDLRDSYRAVLLLHDVKGLTCGEIAVLLGDSTGSVKIRLHRARKQLQAAFETDCVISQDEGGTLVCDPKA